MHEDQCVKHIQSQQERHQSNVSNVAMLSLFLVSLLPIQNPVKNIYDGDFCKNIEHPKAEMFDWVLNTPLNPEQISHIDFLVFPFLTSNK